MSAESRLRFIIAMTGVLIAILGFLYMGDYPKLIALASVPGLGYALVDVGLGAFAVFILIDTLLLREKRIEQQKDTRFWKQVGDRVTELLKAQLMGIVADIALVTNASVVVAAPVDATPDQLSALERQETLKLMQDMSQKIDLLKEHVEEAAVNILDRAQGDLFLERAKKLGDLQTRYWSRFLSPDQVSMLIDLEQMLYNLDTHTAIVAKDRQRATLTVPLDLSRRLSSMYVDEVYKDLQSILKLLVNGIREGTIELPY